jgi:hypothetical protein
MTFGLNSAANNLILLIRRFEFYYIRDKLVRNKPINSKRKQLFQIQLYESCVEREGHFNCQHIQVNLVLLKSL